MLEFNQGFVFLLELLRIFVGFASYFCWFSLIYLRIFVGIGCRKHIILRASPLLYNRIFL